MKIVIQKVKQASVTVDGSVISSIGRGILCYIGLYKDDTVAEVQFMARKILVYTVWVEIVS